MGRQSVWTDEIIRELTVDFVLATDEVWRLQGGRDVNQYRAAGGADPECLGFQDMAAEGHYGPGGGTKQGIYVCTPSGKFLGSVNSLSPKSVREMLQRSLKVWQTLPQAERQGNPQAAQPAHRWEWSSPADGLILKETIRYLSEGSADQQNPDHRFNFDFAWFSAAEAKQFLPPEPMVGKRHEIPPEIFQRLTRCHLLNTAHGESGTYHADQVQGELWAEVVSMDKNVIRVRLTGMNQSNRNRPITHGLSPPAKITAELLGLATWNRNTHQFSRFELVAVGKIFHQVNPEATPDKTIGWYFTLANPKQPFEQLPPTHLHAYAADWVNQPGFTLHDYRPSSNEQMKTEGKQ